MKPGSNVKAHWRLPAVPASAAAPDGSSACWACTLNSMLEQGAIHLEEHIPGDDLAARVLALYTRAVAPGEGALPSADREELSARSVVAADTLGSAADVEAASTAHAALVTSLPKAKSTSGKRAADGAPAGSAAKQVGGRCCCDHFLLMLCS